MENYSPEYRYGIPTADHILTNRFYTVGYSYSMKQPKWVIELIDYKSAVNNASRLDNFRQDHRIPKMFRVRDDDYVGSGYDRGHLIASANRLSSFVANSETFLMSNMSPQLPALNQGLWKELEQRIRELAAKENILEVYCISGPLWALGKSTELLPAAEARDTLVPIPHLFYKSILSESKTGTFKMYSFIIPNVANLGSLSEYQFTTKEVELFSGLYFWNLLSGDSIERKKKTKYQLWF